MRKIRVQQQLEEMLCQHERQLISEVLRRVADKEDREAIITALLAMAKFPELKYTTEDPYVELIVQGLLPHVELSLQKAADTDWCVAHPDDLPGKS